MRTAATAAFGLLSFLAGSTTLLPAQTPNYNEVMLFGSADMVQAVNHPSTGYALELPGVSPAAFTATSTTGVAAGTLTWIWYPSQLHARYEDHLVTGHFIFTRPSSATPAAAYRQTQSGQTSPGVPQYMPRFSIYAAKARPAPTPLPPFGAGYDPDFGKQPLFAYTTQHSFLETRPDVTRFWSVTYNTKVRIPSSQQGGVNAEMVLAFEWKGGEHWTKSGSQSIVTGWSEQHFTPVHWGLASAGSPRAITRFDPTKIVPGSNFNLYSSPFGGYYEDRSTLILHSDWGELRNPTLRTTVYPSYNPGSGLSDVASTAGAFNWDVYSSRNYRGKRVLPLLNIRVGVQTSGTPLFPHMIEVNPADPFLTALWPNPLVNGVISNLGAWLPNKRVTVPALGSRAIGTWIGLESGIIDTTSGSVLDTTNACWFYIAK